MSSNAPQAQQAHNDPFTPRREHGGYWRARKVGKGKNRHWEFKGQHQDEVVKTVLRKSKFFLITPALPFIASVLGPHCGWSFIWHESERRFFLASLRDYHARSGH